MFGNYHIFYKHYIRKQLCNEVTKRATEFIENKNIPKDQDKTDENSLNEQINSEARRLALYELHRMESKFHE